MALPKQVEDAGKAADEALGIINTPPTTPESQTKPIEKAADKTIELVNSLKEQLK